MRNNQEQTVDRRANRFIIIMIVFLMIFWCASIFAQIAGSSKGRPKVESLSVEVFEKDQTVRETDNLNEIASGKGRVLKVK